ncbi:hypothetical protein CYMTET_39664 [Cymbomonas tetramitiformis]|uniref:Tyrosine specific protein phosphatases domain-containing protein n=1 Tax=Cymbomonas tetramitiformis TaxID=36881 RepID=A0AAE0F4F6_9CHLO|nr:hypothetical protein CYMTET_39664 [Cymbomonas tetramitiformis]
MSLTNCRTSLDQLELLIWADLFAVLFLPSSFCLDGSEKKTKGNKKKGEKKKKDEKKTKKRIAVQNSKSLEAGNKEVDDEDQAIYFGFFDSDTEKQDVDTEDLEEVDAEDLEKVDTEALGKVDAEDLEKVDTGALEEVDAEDLEEVDTEDEDRAEELSEEDAAYKKRAEESAAAGVVADRPPAGGDPPPPGPWQWTLNWDYITTMEKDGVEILVGSCPRSAEDMERLANEAGVEAILSLQSDVCIQAMEIDAEGVYDAALASDVVYTRVPVFDFDRIDQAAMLPEMVRQLGILAGLNRRVYVHCTAGINRATLTVLGYLTFVKGEPLEDALGRLKAARPQANPYVECWKIARSRMLAGKEHDLYLATQAKGNSIEEGGDWIMRDWDQASTEVIMKHYARCIDNDIRSMQAYASVIPTKSSSES